MYIKKENHYKLKKIYIAKTKTYASLSRVYRIGNQSWPVASDTPNIKYRKRKIYLSFS